MKSADSRKSVKVVHPLEHRVFVCGECPKSIDAIRSRDLASRIDASLALTRAGGFLEHEVRVERSGCLMDCQNANLVAIMAPGKLTYVFGEIEDSAHVDAFASFVAKYSVSPDGSVEHREWSAHLIGRHLPYLSEIVGQTLSARVSA